MLKTNRAVSGDAILGGAYEYLMHRFATESGKNRGQFYTPAAITRLIAHILRVRQATTRGRIPPSTIRPPRTRQESLFWLASKRGKVDSLRTRHRRAKLPSRTSFLRRKGSELIEPNVRGLRPARISRAFKVMTVEIKPEQLAIIQQHLATGLFQSADEVVATALANLPRNHHSNHDAVALMIAFSRNHSVSLAPGETVGNLVPEGHRYKWIRLSWIVPLPSNGS